MKPNAQLCRQTIAAAIVWITAASNASAQLDRVYDKSGESTSGTVSKTSPQQVQITRAGSTREFAASDVQKILFEGDPAALTRGRESAINGDYEQALRELKNVAIESLPRDVIKADAEFHTLLCQAKLALAGKGSKEEAGKRTLAFASRYKNSWHSFDAARLLGDLELAQNNTDKALRYYGFLSNSPSAEVKIESAYLQGLVHLKRGDSDAALKQFDRVIGAKAQTAQTARIQGLAKAGKAVALARGGKASESLVLVNQLIAELNPADTELAARVYNAQGAGFEADGDDEGAIMAYLHTHLMFSSQPDAHAESLKRLVELWPKIGKPERAAAARQELQQRYPGF